MKNIINNIRKNWKTSLLGGGSLGAAVLYYCNTPQPDIKVLGGMIMVGLLGLFSADANKVK